MSGAFHDPGKEKFVGCWLSTEYFEALVTKARANRCTPSEEMRKAVELYVRAEVIEARR